MLDRVVFAGAGRTVESILERVLHLAPVLILDTSQAALDELSPVAVAAATPVAAAASSAIPIHAVSKRLADATSRFVLEEARGDTHHAAALVAATGDDRRNLEVCRLARELSFAPVVGIVIDPAQAPAYEALGARAVVRAQILGTVVEQALRYDGLVIASTVGQGRGEIIEFVVLPSSPAIGVPLSQLHASGWRIAAIYRGTDLVIPTGETAIQAEDRVLVIGDPSILSHVAEQLRVGMPQFPLSHGKGIVLYSPQADRKTDGVAQEAEMLTRRTRAQGLVRLRLHAKAERSVIESSGSETSTQSPRPHSKTLETLALDGTSFTQHVAQFRQLRPGLVVTEKRRRGLVNRLLGRAGFAATLCNTLPCPVLFASGRTDYTRVVLPLLPGITDLTLADAAIDLARMFELPLCTVRVLLPEFLEARDKNSDLVASEIARRSRLYRLRSEEITLEGNPVSELLRLAQPSDLLVLARRRSSRDSFTSADVALRLLATSSSCLIYTQNSGPGGRSTGGG